MLVRKFDTQADRLAVGARRSPVGRLHDAGAAAGDNRHAALGDLATDRARRLVERIGLGRAGTAEDGHCRTKLGKRAKAIDKLCLNAQYAPGVGVQPVGRVLGRQQVGVGVVLGNHGAAHDHGAASVRLVVGRLTLDVLILNHGYSYREKEKRAGPTPCVKHPPEHQLFGMVPTMHQALARLRSAVAALSNPPPQDCSSSRSRTRRNGPR